MLPLASRLALAIMRVGRYDGFNLLVACGACAGQIVGHAHIHIIPRHATDGICLPPRSAGFADETEKQALIEAVRRRLSTHEQ